MGEQEMKFNITATAEIIENEENRIKVWWKAKYPLAENRAHTIILYRIDQNNAQIEEHIPINQQEGFYQTHMILEIDATINQRFTYTATYVCGTISAWKSYELYPRWQAGSRQIIGPRRINEIAMFGAHNAGAIKPHNDTNSRFLNWFYDLLICQNGIVYKQLLAGVRYLDLRVIVIEGERDPRQKYLVEHGLYIQKLENILGDVKRFCDETEEIVILDIHSLACDDIMRYNEEEEILALRVYLAQIFGDLMYASPEIPTFNELWQTKRRIVISANDDPVRNGLGVFSIRHVYANRGSPVRVLGYFNTMFQDQLEFDICRSFNVQVTRNYLLSPLTGLRFYADRVNHGLKTMIQDPNWRRNVNIISLDFVFSSNIMEEILAINNERFG